MKGRGRLSHLECVLCPVHADVPWEERTLVFLHDFFSSELIVPYFPVVGQP